VKFKTKTVRHLKAKTQTLSKSTLDHHI